MKYYKFWVLLAGLGLIVSSFLPWTYYPDLDKVFTGFFSERNFYGKPGKVFVFFAVVSIIFSLIEKIWAKRFNLFFAALNLAYLIKTYILFTNCYGGTCPEKRYGIYILIASGILLLITSLFPDQRIEGPKTENTQGGESLE